MDADGCLSLAELTERPSLSQSLEIWIGSDRKSVTFLQRLPPAAGVFEYNDNLFSIRRM